MNPTGNAIDHEDTECKVADQFMKCTWEVVPKMVSFIYIIPEATLKTMHYVKSSILPM